MTLAQYTEIPRGAGYPALPREPQPGDTVIHFRFYLQGRKYGRQLLISDGDGFVYEAAAEIAQTDANRAGTIVEFKLTPYGEPLVPGGKPGRGPALQWEAVVPRKPWPYDTDWDRHVQQALAAGAEADSGTGGRYAHCWDAVADEDEPVPFVPVHESRPPVGRDALAEPPVLGNTLYLGIGESATVENPHGGTVHVTVDAEAERGAYHPLPAPGRVERVILAPDVMFGAIEADGDYLEIVTGTTAEEAKAWWREFQAAAGPHRSVDRFAEPSVTPFDPPLPDPFAYSPFDTRAHLGLGESIGVDAPGGERFVITVVPASAELSITRGAEQHTVSLPIGQTYSVEDVDGATVHVVAVEDAAVAMRAYLREQGVDS